MSYYVHHRVHTQLSGCGVAQSGLGRWTHNPEIGCSNQPPATKVEACDVRGRVFSALSDVRSIRFLDVKGCLKFFGVVFRGVLGMVKVHAFNLGVLKVFCVDGRVLVLRGVDGVDCLD